MEQHGESGSGPAPADVWRQRLAAVTRVREVLRGARFPLAVASAEPAEGIAEVLGQELDDYAIARLRRLDAPVLAVVGGPTGAGKSTLLNSLIRAPVSRAGVLRPTTRSPLLVCHPFDMSWFAEQTLLPGLSRSSRPGEHSLQIIHAPGLSPGLALLDAPDFDSVEAHNRDLARELLASGDLWLFVTTAARYADAVPWAVLRDGRDRGTSVAIVLNRLPAEAHEQIVDHFQSMLAGQGLADLPVFALNESTVDGHGLLPELDVLPIKVWIDAVSRDPARRHLVARTTLLGALARAHDQVEGLVVAALDQVSAARTLGEAATQAYAAAMSTVEVSVRTGTLLRGTVYARWREMIDSGELRSALRVVESGGRGRPSGVRGGGRAFQNAVVGALVRLVVEADVVAAQRCGDAWRADPAGRVLLDGDSSLARPWRGFTDAVHDLVHGWQMWLRTARHMAGPEGTVVRPEPAMAARATRPRQPGIAPPGSGAPPAGSAVLSTATVLLATIVAIAPPADRVTAAGSGANMLRAVVNDPIAAHLGALARAELLSRVGDLLSAERERHLAALARAGVDLSLPDRLSEAAAALPVPARTSTPGLGQAA